MTRKILLLLAISLLYQTIAVFLLYSSSYLNVVSYYTHPPYKSDIELRRLPLLFGDQIALKILRSKNKDATVLVNEGAIGMAAVLSSYQHNQVLHKNDARYRTFQIADLFINAGYDLSRCEVDGRSTAFVLQQWGELDEENKEFLSQRLGGQDIFSCNYGPGPTR